MPGRGHCYSARAVLQWNSDHFVRLHPLQQAVMQALASMQSQQRLRSARHLALEEPGGREKAPVTLGFRVQGLGQDVRNPAVVGKASLHNARCTAVAKAGFASHCSVRSLNQDLFGSLLHVHFLIRTRTCQALSATQRKPIVPARSSEGAMRRYFA